MAAAGLPLEPAVGDLATMCERTKATLGSLITRPPMKDKLLSRPPFRFIHDAVTAVTAATGFLDGAFQGAELKPKEMERDEKHNYLTKLISLVERATRSSLGVDPVNVAAGKEPEMTNYLLQAIAHAATAAPEPAPAKEPKRAPAPAPAPARREAPAPSPAPAPSASTSSSRPSKPTLDPESQGFDGSHDRTRELVGAHISKPKLSDKLLGRPPLLFIYDIFLGLREATGLGAGLLPAALEDRKAIKERENKLAFLGMAIDLAEEVTGVRCPAQPELVASGKDSPATNVFLQMLGAAAQRGDDKAARAEGVMGEGEGADSDEEDGGLGLGLGAGAGGLAGGGAGKHTADILGRARQEAGRAGARAEGKEDEAAAASGGGGGLKMGRIGAAARGGGASGQKLDLAGLREAVQGLVQSATPLGQSMGYAREDLDDMRAELAQWGEETRRQAEALEAARQVTAEAVRPFEARLRSAEDACQGLEARIAQAQAKIASNDGRVRELVMLAVTRGKS